jgi:multiple antibiotic resistance protein
MELGTIDLYQVLDVFLLLLIGIGPKIALVPFLELTSDMSAEVQRKVARKMIQTAFVTALVLLILGKLLMALLHISPAAISIAGGIVLFLLGILMVKSPGKNVDHHEQAEGRDPMKMAVYPLAVPLLLNPAGIVILMSISGESTTIVEYVTVIIVLLLVIGLDWLVFGNINSLSKHLDPSNMTVTEVVFGILLAALAVTLVLEGMVDLGILDLIPH